jgi:DNA-binding transcriptional MerR regulator
MNAITLPTVDVDVPDAGLTIGEVAGVTGLSVQALRFYEREGLMLDPARRNASGHRRYQRPDIEWIKGLLMLRETGMSIGDMRVLAELSRQEGSEAERLRVLEKHRQSVLDALTRTHRHLAALQEKIDAYRDVVRHTTRARQEQESR